MWFFPKSPTLPYVSARMRKLKICLRKPCDEVKIVVHYHRHKCAVVHFHYHVYNLPSNGQVTGIIWEFGDDNISYDASPIHDYDATGEWVVKLTVHMIINGKCCTKTIYTKIKT